MFAKRGKTIVAFVFAGILCLALIFTETIAEAGPLTLKYSVAWPKGHFSTDTAYRIAELVEKRTNGEIKITVFPAQQLFKVSKHFDAHRDGLIDLSCTPSAYFTGFEPMGEYETLPGLFSSIAEGKRIYNPFAPRNEPIKIMNEVMAKHNMRFIACNWMTPVFASTKIVIRPKDLKGVSVRVSGKCVSTGYQNAGASIVAMPSAELYTALQRKTIDACLTSADTVLTSHIYEVTNFINLYPAYVNPNEHWITLSTWNKLTLEQQGILMDCAKIADEEALAAYYKQHQQLIKIYKDRKDTVHEPTPEEVKEWNDALRPSALALFKKLTGKDGERFLAAVERLR